MSLLVGSICAVAYPVAGSVPPGFLACDGSAVSRSTYAALFQAVATSWGAGDGATTFNLPDLRGQFVRGVDDGTGRDPNSAQRTASGAGGSTGDAVGSAQTYATALPRVGTTATTMNGQHQHFVPHLPTDSSWYEIAGSHYAQWNSGSGSTSQDGLHSHTVATGGDHESRPVNLYADYVIYAGI